MKVIPVIDYQQGQVVLAQMGQRDSYQPVSSALSDNADIHNVMQGILALAPFKTIYIADLGCIESQQLDRQLWPTLCHRYPQIEFWLDLGAWAVQWDHVMSNVLNARPVLGTECYSQITTLTSHLEALNQYKPLLSVDFKDNRILGPCDFLEEFNAWPDEVIILSLSQVGSNNGPDHHSINSVRQSFTGKNLFYGGGTRDQQDIDLLENLNIKGVLVANGLHSGKFNAAFLQSIS